MSMYPIATAQGNGSGAIYFNNIPQNFTHLQIRILGRSGTSGTSGNLYHNINAGGYTYSNHQLYGNGSSIGSSSNTGLPYVFFGSAFPAASSTANIMGAFIIDWFDYTNTNKYKVCRVTGGNDQNGSGVVQISSGLIQTTGAMTSFFLDTEGSFTTATTVQLYGISTSSVTGA